MLKMNSSKKYYLLFIIFSIFIIQISHVSHAAIEHQVDEQILGNMMENLFANMTPAEQEEFTREIERQQQKIMQMTPEERDLIRCWITNL